MMSERVRSNDHQDPPSYVEREIIRKGGFVSRETKNIIILDDKMKNLFGISDYNFVHSFEDLVARRYSKTAHVFAYHISSVNVLWMRSLLNDGDLLTGDFPLCLVQVRRNLYAVIIDDNHKLRSLLIRRYGGVRHALSQ